MPAQKPKSFPPIFALLIFLCVFVSTMMTPAQDAVSPKSDLPGQTSASANRPQLDWYKQLPLAFEPNEGQADPNVRFLSRSAEQTLFLAPGEAQLMLRSVTPKSTLDHLHAIPVSTLKIRFAGANNAAELVPMDEQPGKSNYFVGNDDAKWRTNIPNYSRVLYRSLYPGVDLVFYGSRGHLEHDFVIAPGSDYRQIVLDLSGGRNVRMAKDGSVTIAVGAGAVHFSAPSIYQLRGNERIEVAGGFRLTGHRLAFRLASYDKTLPLIIDPVLSYSTYLAGSQGELGTGIVVDSTGNAYVTGLTFSLDFPTKGPFQSACNACNGSSPDVFVTKLNATGTGLVYSTYLGGSAYDQPFSIAIDAAGNAIVGGSTSSSDFPVKNPIQTPAAFYTQGFISSLSPDGASLNFSTYLGGTGGASVDTVTTDSSGNVYAAGLTDSADFPITPVSNVIGVPPGYPLNDIFVAKLSGAGSLVFATTIGPDPQQQQFNTIFAPANANGIAVDSDQNIYLAGKASQGFPVTPGAFQTSYIGPQPFCGTCTMAFAAKLKADGSAFVYASYLGGSGGDQITGLAIDSGRNIYVTGNTSSTDFPTTAGAFQPTFPSSPFGPNCCQTFVSKIDPTGSALLFSTFLGAPAGYGFGLNGTSATGIAVDPSGDVFLTGTTNSLNFPLKNPLQTILPSGSFGPGSATYVTELNNTGSGLLFSTLFSGSTSTQAAAIAIDNAASSKTIYVTGTSYDTDLPTTAGAFQTSIVSPPYGQPSHAFVTKFDIATPSPAVCADQSSLFFFTSVNTDSYPATVNLTNCGNAPLNVSHIAISGIFTETDNCQVPIVPGQMCTVNVTFHPTARGFFTGTLTISDNAPIQPLNIPLQGQGIAPVVQLSTNLLQFDDQLVGQTGLPTPLFVFNQGDDLLQISSVALTGTDFTVDSTGCAAPVQPQSLCAILVTFHPLAAGIRTGNLMISDNAPDSPQSVALQGNGLTAYPVPTVLSINPTTLLQNGNNQTISIYGTGFFGSSRIRINGIQIATTYNGESSLSAVVPLAFLTHLGTLKVDVFTPIPGGGLSNPSGLLIYQDVPLSANDLVFEPFTRQIYASVSPNASSNANTIVSLDPESEIIGKYIPIGNGPNRLGLSDDGKFLYVGLDSDHTVQQFDTTSGTLGSLVPLPNDPSYGNNLTAHEIHVVPGRPQDYVVSLSQYGFPAGLSLVSNGVQLSDLLALTSQNVAVSSICFLSDPTTFYGSNGYQLLQFGIQNNSSLQVNATPPAPQGLSGQFACDSKYLYDYSGLVFDPLANQTVGQYPLPPASFGNSVLPETPLGRTYLLTYGNTNFLVFDQKTFTQVGSIPLPQNSFEPYRLIRWGQDGFAFLNGSFSGTGNDVILMRSSLVQPSAGPNPKPRIFKVEPHVRENNGNFQLTVEGSGFVPGAVVRWNNSDRTTIFQSANVLIADIPNSDVADAGAASITVFNPPLGGGISNAVRYSIREEVLLSIALTPMNPSILKGANQQFTAIGTYSDGTTRDLTTTVMWSSRSKQVATIAKSGLASGVNTGTSAIEATSGTVSASTILTVYVGDFAEQVSSNSLTVVAGQAVGLTVTVIPVSGFSADVTLNVAGLPAGATASFSPSATIAHGSGSVTLTISTTKATTLGSFALTLVGAAGSLSHTAPLTLGVNSSPGNFNAVVSPNPITWPAGTDGIGASVTIVPTGGFTGDVTLTVSGVPPGFQASFTPTNIVQGGSGAAYLFTLADPNATPGAYSFQITATSGAIVNTVTVGLNIVAYP